MARKTAPPSPSTQKLLKDLGENIRLARLRRKYSTTLVAERAGMSRSTLYSIERGDSGVTIGAYVNVLLCLGLQEDLAQIASDDLLGRKLQDSTLSRKQQGSRGKKSKSAEAWEDWIEFGQNTLIGGVLLSAFRLKRNFFLR